MDLFKRRKEQVNMPQAEPPKAERPAPEIPVTPPPPDSEQLAEAKRRAEERIRGIERKIADEREAWASRIKEKEEEGISLKARLDALMRQSEQEREKQESKMTLLQQQVQRDLNEVEKLLEAEIKSWNERLSAKDSEIEDAKREAVFRETQDKLEAEASVRNMKASLEETEQKCKALERQLLEEQGQWIGRIKGREDEILNLKTQISLRETQLAMEEEKSNTAEKEMAAAWQAQIKGLEEKSRAQREEWAADYQRKEEELRALRTALDQRLTSLKLVTEREEKEVLGTKSRVEEKIKSIEAQLAADQVRWAGMLKAREEELKQLKADLMLRESQEKADREKKQKELKEAEAAASRQAKDTRQKAEEEKLAWQRKITAKEEEIKVFTIQAELKLKEINDLQEKRTIGAAEERKALGGRLSELKAALEAEKARGKQELEARNAEMLAYQQEWQAKQAASLAADEKALSALKERTGALETELAELGTALEQEKTRWHELLTAKEHELGTLKFEAAGKEGRAQQALEAFSAQLAKEIQPLVDQVKSFENRVNEYHQQKQAETARKDAQKRSIEERYKKQEEVLRTRFETLSSKLKSEEKIASDKAAQVRAQVELQAKQNAAAMERLAGEEAALRDKLAHVDDKLAREKEKLVAANRENKEQLAAKSKTLEQAYAAAKEEVRKDVADKGLAIEQLKARCAESEAVLQKELDARLGEEADLKERAEHELHALIQLQQKEKEEHSEALKGREDAIVSLEKTLGESESRLARETAAFGEELARTLAPLEKRIAELEQLTAREKEDGRRQAASLGEEGRARAERSEQIREDIRKRLAGVVEAIHSGKQGLETRVAELTAAGAQEARQFEEALRKLNEKEQALRRELAADEEKAAAEKAGLKRDSETRKAQLAAAVQRLENERQDLAQRTEAEIKAITEEAAETERMLAAQETAAKKELAAKEKELAAIENKGAKDIAALTEETANIKEERAAKIAEIEREIASLQQVSKETRERAQEEIRTLRSSLASELRPLAARRREKKAELALLSTGADGQIAALRQKRAELKQALAGTEERLAADRKAWADRIGAIKTELAEKIHAIVEERSRIETGTGSAVAAKTEEFKRLESELAYHKESYERQKEALSREGARAGAQLREEIDSLSGEKSTLERETAAKVAALKETIESLEKQLAQGPAAAQERHEQAEKSAENYQRRAERRIERARAQLEQLKEHSQAEFTAAENRLAVLTEEAGKKETAWREELEREGKAFAEEKYRLEKQKAELDEQLKDLRMRSREQLLQKEKETLALQAELTEKERAWALAWQQKETELAAEKNALVREIESLETKIREESDIAGRRITDKNAEISEYRSQHELRLQNLAAEHAAKKSSWDETNARLAEQVKAISEEMESVKKERDENLTAREKELAALRSNLEFWEQRAKAEEEKRITAWSDERLALEGKIAETSEKLDAARKGYALQLNDRDAAFQKLRDDAYAGEEAEQKRWKEVEAGFAEKKSALLAEIEAWEKKVREESSVSDKQIKDLDREIERLKLDSALKDTSILSDRQKNERQWRKLQRELDDKLDALKRSLSGEKEEWLGKLRAKEEEIKTLQVRLALREERRTAEIARRKDGAEKILAALEEELKLVKEKYGSLKSAASDIASRQDMLAALRRKVEGKEALWDEEKKRREEAAAGARAELEADLGGLETELKQESQRLEQLFILKEKQIGSLVSHMAIKETDLSSEREQTRHVLDSLRRKAGEFSFVLAQRYGEKGAVRDRETLSLFDEAVELFGAGEYLKAQGALEKLLETRPDFTGAYQYLSLCHFNLKNKPQALAMACRAYELEPHNEELKSWIDTLTRENIND